MYIYKQNPTPVTAKVIYDEFASFSDVDYAKVYNSVKTKYLAAPKPYNVEYKYNDQYTKYNALLKYSTS